MRKRMRLRMLGIVGALIVILAITANCAQAYIAAEGKITFVNTFASRGIVFSPKNPQWSRWASLSRVAMPSAVVRVLMGSNPCDGGADGCSWGRPGSGYPLQTYADSRDTFYFEMGHIFDWTMLTNAERRYITRRLGDGRWHWWDSQAVIRAGGRFGVGVENGMEGVFAEVYQACAWGQRVEDHWFSSLTPFGLRVSVPTATIGNWNFCAYLDAIAARS